SSLSVTAIASACRHPARVAGLHFFNPVPLMRIVEIIGGARTAPETLQKLKARGGTTRHAGVEGQDTPGFLVNHAGRGYTAAALRAVQEGVADFAAVDAIMREQVRFAGGGFRLGPFELLALTGLDVSQPVMESIYRQFYDEPRFRPSVIGAQRLAAGLLGRKSGEGFYRYADGAAAAGTEPPVPSVDIRPPVWIAPGPHAERVAAAARALGAVVRDGASPGAQELVLVAPLGLDATAAARANADVGAGGLPA